MPPDKSFGTNNVVPEAPNIMEDQDLFGMEWESFALDPSDSFVQRFIAE